LSSAAIALLERCGAKSGLIVSDISWWEIAVKAGKGKLTLSMDSGLWLNRASNAPGISFLPLDREVLLLSTRLTGSSHNDPVDRMLIATAQLNNLPLVTADKLIIDYARAHAGIPVVDARR
jgi:PIN domain nuclease of toxin-antitoxin system